MEKYILLWSSYVLFDFWCADAVEKVSNLAAFVPVDFKVEEKEEEPFERDV